MLKNETASLTNDDGIHFDGFQHTNSTSDYVQLPLPKRIKLIDTKAFVKVNLSEMLLKGDAKKTFMRLNEKCINLNEQATHCFYYAVLHALNGRRKVSTVQRWVNELDLFIRTFYSRTGQPLGTITFQIFNWYSTKKNASQQKLLRSSLLYWSNLGLPGIAHDLQDYLAVSESPKPRQTIEIQNSVEHERPFKITEIRRILAAVDTLYIEGKFDAQDNLLWRLMVSEALRPSQMGLLLIGDIQSPQNDSANLNITLNVPIVKQSGTAARDYMFETQLSESTSRAVRGHVQFIEDRFQSLPAPSYPLFCVSRRDINPTVESLDIAHLIARTRKLLAMSIGDLGHHELFSRRFKHTKLTHLAVLGAPVEVLAKAGYQTTTVSLRHYINLTDEAFVEYEKLMSETHEEILYAFRGRIIDRTEATNKDTEHTIFSPDLEHDLGSCSVNPCDAFAPIACYTCPRFEAFKDGTHERVLEFLLKRQKLASRLALPPESTARDDYLIAAVKYVIEKISQDRNANG